MKDRSDDPSHHELLLSMVCLDSCDIYSLIILVKVVCPKGVVYGVGVYFFVFMCFIATDGCFFRCCCFVFFGLCLLLFLNFGYGDIVL